MELRFRAPDEPARPVVVPTPVSRPPLTVADDRFVGEPVAPATPFHHLTRFDRLVAQYSNLPLGTALGLATTSPEPGGEHQHEPPEEQRQEPPEEQPPRRRAATLGESRRRGLNGYRTTGTAAEPVPQRDTPGTPERDTTPGTPERDTTPGTPERDSAGEPDRDGAGTALSTPHTCPDLGDVNTLDDLAGRLYRHVHTRLRTELLVDRERSGLLADPI